MTDLVVAHCVLRQPSPGAGEEALRRLRELGFEVLRLDRAGVVFRAPRDRFEAAFDTTLEAYPAQPMAGKGAGSEAVHYRSIRPIQVPPSLMSVVAEVALLPPPEFYV